MSRQWLEVATAALVRSPGEDYASMSRARDVHGLAPLTMFPPGLCAWDEWERRAQHREACIAAVKRSGDYVSVAQHFARPSTPNPRQAEVSKRAWEKGVRQWRMDLKALAGGLAPVAAGVGERVRVPCREPMYIDLPSLPLRVRVPCREPMYIDPDGERVRVPCREPFCVPWPAERERERRRSRSPRGANEECNEEVWQRRSAHRAAGVAAVKRSADYISATADPHVPRPNTPDPTDRKLAKRAWERGVQQWRVDLKAVVLQLLPPISARPWQHRVVSQNLPT